MSPRRATQRRPERKPVEAPKGAPQPSEEYRSTYLRAENEDDDGYDPYSIGLRHPSPSSSAIPGPRNRLLQE